MRSDAAPEGGIVTATDGTVRTLTLTRPERRNAVTLEDRTALAGAIAEADVDPSIRAIVITGHGDHFCAGGDITEFAVERSRTEAERYGVEIAQAVFRALRATRTPTVARVRGAAAGAGMYLALGCDIVVTEQGGFFQPSHLELAVVPDWGAVWLLPRLVGLARAKAALLSGARIDFATAERWGLVAECVLPGELDAVVTHYCERIAAIPEAPIALTRRGLDASLDRTLDAFLEWEAIAIGDVLTRPEHRDRVDAFLARRDAPRADRQ